jgi:hypothetical protein
MLNLILFTERAEQDFMRDQPTAYPGRRISVTGKIPIPDAVEILD